MTKKPRFDMTLRKGDYAFVRTFKGVLQITVVADKVIVNMRDTDKPIAFMDPRAGFVSESTI